MSNEEKNKQQLDSIISGGTPTPNTKHKHKKSDIRDFSVIPRGWLGYASYSGASQTLSTTPEDLTDLEVTVDLPVARLLKVSFLGEFVSGTTDDELIVYLDDSVDGTVQTAHFFMDDEQNAENCSTFALVEATAGEHTYKVQAERGDGGGTPEFNPENDSVAYILVEDIGPAPSN